MSAIRILPWPVHEGLEYLAGVFLLLAPFLFGFLDSSAFPVFIGIGVIVLAAAVLTRGPAGIVDVLPIAAHAGVDYGVAFFLVIAPFVFAYRDVRPALMASVLLGIAHIVVTLVTAYPGSASSGDQAQA